MATSERRIEIAPAALAVGKLPLADAADRLAGVARYAYGRGWALGTSGNFSVVLSRAPLELAITTSGSDKGALTAGEIVAVDGSGAVVDGSGRPSDETALHLALARAASANAVLHTHSVWSTILSDAHAPQGGLELTGFEMLKGLAGVHTHEHREWLPILENSQALARVAAAVEDLVAAHPGMHGFFLRRHGLYTWGDTLDQAKRHLEVLEFILEVIGRERSLR